MLGHCVKFERSKGYGFIIPLDPDDPNSGRCFLSFFRHPTYGSMVTKISPARDEG